MSNSIKITQAVSWLMDVDPVATGKRLCKQRKALNLSQKKLSALFDEGGRSASITAISRWENGHDVPTISNLAFLVCLYHVSFDDLIVTFMQSHGGDGDDDGQAVSFYTLYCWIVLERMVIMTKDTVINTIRDLKQTKIITSHDLDMILDTCDRVILINEGKVVADGEAGEILRDRELLEANHMELPLRFQK